jgi:hypothetical protein
MFTFASRLLGLTQHWPNGSLMPVMQVEGQQVKNLVRDLKSYFRNLRMVTMIVDCGKFLKLMVVMSILRYIYIYNTSFSNKVI